MQLIPKMGCGILKLYIYVYQKGVIIVGLVTRRSDQLDKLFENFAIDPKKKQKTTSKKQENDDKKSSKKEED
jgi:hypothetical protein